MSRLEETLALQLRALGVPAFEREHVFAPPRRFRADFAWPKQRVIVEVNGGNYVGGRHVRPAALKNEYEKIRIAQYHGWKYLPFDSSDVKSGSAAIEIADLLNDDLPARCRRAGL